MACVCLAHRRPFRFSCLNSSALLSLRISLLSAVNEHLVTPSETAAIFFNGRRWYGRITEFGMALNLW
jgi:hypothetical protein